MTAPSAAEVVAALRAARSEAELPGLRKRLAPGEAAFGMRMRDLFDVAKRHRALPLTEVELLLEHEAYEPRLAAYCVLDFQARGRLSEPERRERHELYLAKHDRITTWDMVDRSAPRVVGGYLAGRSVAPLHELAAAPQPLRRRTAITAPLYFVKYGSDGDVAEGFALARTLAADEEPVVHNAVGIFLKHAGARDPQALVAFLDEHVASMPRAAVRLAVAKLAPVERSRYVG